MAYHALSNMFLYLFRQVLTSVILQILPGCHVVSPMISTTVLWMSWASFDQSDWCIGPCFTLDILRNPLPLLTQNVHYAARCSCSFLQDHRFNPGHSSLIRISFSHLAPPNSFVTPLFRNMFQSIKRLLPYSVPWGYVLMNKCDFNSTIQRSSSTPVVRSSTPLLLFTSLFRFITHTLLICVFECADNTWYKRRSFGVAITATLLRLGKRPYPTINRILLIC